VTELYHYFFPSKLHNSLTDLIARLSSGSSGAKDARDDIARLQELTLMIEKRQDMMISNGAISVPSLALAVASFTGHVEVNNGPSYAVFLIGGISAIFGVLTGWLVVSLRSSIVRMQAELARITANLESSLR
jgi:hypothetical protein